MKIKLIALLLLMVTLQTQSRAVTLIFMGPKQNSWWIKPVLLPNTPTTAVSSDIYVCELDATNSSGSAVTISVSDNQGSPVPFLSAASIAASSTWIALALPANGPCRYFPGGIIWSASTANVVSIHMAGNQ